jgi:glycosyltransferase involved in cell wall biosynthesis
VPEHSDDLDFTLVVPFYNPGTAVRQTIKGAAAALDAAGISYEIIAVSDGSTDDSPRSLDGLLPGQLQLIEVPFNRGKGAALRLGMSRGRGRLVGFIDADGDIPPDLLPQFVAVAQVAEADIVFGSKQHPGSTVAYPPLRRIYSWGYRWLVRLLFDLAVPDTQTGIKVVRRDVLTAILPKMVEERFAFDVELFAWAHRLGFNRLVELPVRVDKQYTSTVSTRDVWSILLDSLRIYRRFRRNHTTR